MSVTPKKLFQTQIGTGTNTLYTTPTGYRTQITEMWVSNTTTDPINFTLKAHGDLEENILLNEVEIEENLNIDGMKVVLDDSEVIYGEGENLVVTGYGIEEDVS